MEKEAINCNKIESVDEEEDSREESKDITGQKSRAAAETRFTKEQLLRSARYRDRRDLVDALLSLDREYTVAEVEQKIRKYKKGKVK